LAREEAHQAERLEEHEHVQDDGPKRKTQQHKAKKIAALGAVHTANVEQYTKPRSKILHTNESDCERCPDRVFRLEEIDREKNVRGEVGVKNKHTADSK
jgi:hypothetical protein